MSPELITAVEDAVALLESWRGRLASVEETLARSAGEGWEYNRHGCTRSRFSFIVESVHMRFSGAAITVLGALSGGECEYEISLDALVAVQRPDGNSVAVKERFGKVAERVTVFRLVEPPL